MKRIFVVLFFSVLAAGCAPIEPIRIVGANGGEAYTMVCSGKGRTIEKCYAKAGEVCPNGYAIMDRSNTTMVLPNGGSFPLVVSKVNLTIECK